MFIQTELTPNPQTIKFIPGRVVMNDGTAFFKSKEEATDSPFAQRLFDIEEVKGVFFGSDFVTITKDENVEWQTLKPIVLGAIVDHYNSGQVTIQDKEKAQKISESSGDETDLVKQIKELLDTRVRPAVASDGGDIVFKSFEDGVVYLHMQGACAGCPSSTATLKMGIENMLKHYVPEVKEVRPIDE